MMIWYMLNPTDTLFFRGSESLEMGADHFAQSLFPPPVSVLYGAIRSYIIKKSDLPFKTYAEKKAPPEIYDTIGNPTQNIEELPFTIFGPFFLQNNSVFIPTPFHWYGTCRLETENYRLKVKISKYEPLPKTFPIKASKHILWPIFKEHENTEENNERQLLPLSGSWTNWDNIAEPLPSRIIEVYQNEYFFTSETRTGIALDVNRRVRTGHLYSMTHIRLKQGISLCIAIDHNPGLENEGILFLGGENRFVYYKKIKPHVKELPNHGDLYMAFTPIPASTQANASIVITDKLQYRGGWDLACGFHKPLEAHFPAGSVFSKKVSKHCIPIQA